MLANHTILITGGSRGIGLAIAHELASLGARLILCAREQLVLEEALASLPGQGHLAQVLDVGSATSVARLSEWLQDKVERLDGLVNSAGIYGPIGPLAEIDVDAFEEAWRINFLGTLRICQSLLPRLQASRRGKIVNLSGGGAASAFPFYSAYACSKAALVRFTENTALEYPGLDINCLAPGFVVTRLHQQTLAAGPERASAAFFETTRQTVEQGGVPPQKAAQLTAFLMSPESDGISGKFLSAPWDPWQRSEFQAKLRSDKNFATLRRIDDKGFSSKS